jgi:hypothetical protein
MTGATPPHSQSQTVQPNHTIQTGSEALVCEFNVGVFFKHNANLDYDEINLGTESDARYRYYTAEEKLQECPRITIKLGRKKSRRFLTQGVS